MIGNDRRLKLRRTEVRLGESGVDGAHEAVNGARLEVDIVLLASGVVKNSFREIHFILPLNDAVNAVLVLVLIPEPPEVARVARIGSVGAHGGRPTAGPLQIEEKRISNCRYIAGE